MGAQEALFINKVKLLFKGAVELFKSFKILNIARLGPKVPFGYRVVAIIERHRKRCHQVGVNIAGGSKMFTRNNRFYATAWYPVADIFNGPSLILVPGLDYGFIIVNSRRAARNVVHFAHPLEIGITVDPGHIPRVHIGVVQTQHLRNLQNDVGHIVDRICPIGFNASNDGGCHAWCSRVLP